MKIYFKETACYKNADEQTKRHKLYSPDSVFDLGKMSNEKIAEEMKAFVMDRGTKLTALSLNSELYPFNQLCQVLNDEFPELCSFKDVEEEVMIKRAKVWLVKNGKNRTQRRFKSDIGKEIVIDADLIRYIRNIYRYFFPESKEFEFDSDKWWIESIPLEIKVNPVSTVKTLNFEGIPQLKIRAETKQAVYIHLSCVTLGTVMAELTAIRRFSNFIYETYPEVESLNEIDREVFERYLLHLNTADSSRKSYSTDLCHLRSLLITVGKINENKELETLIVREDLGKRKAVLYKTYSDSELKRLNAAIVNGDEQVARALFLQQMLGTRIGEVLTLRQNSISQSESGKYFIVINQIKTRRSYKKVINEEIRDLFNRACVYTNEKYGTQEYVFVDDKNPQKPMRYKKIQYHLMVMVQKNDLRDDSGELFGVGTHTFRRNYGQKLAEMHVDDSIIAKLLGHSNTSSLKNYRRLKNETLSAETRETRDRIDAQIRAVTGNWIESISKEGICAEKQRESEK